MSDLPPAPESAPPPAGGPDAKEKTELGDRTVYVGNLAYSVGWQDLKDKMREIGEVEHVEVLEYWDGRKTGSAIVRFKEKGDAQEAIKKLYDVELKGRRLYLREDKEGGKGPGSGKNGGKNGGKAVPPDVACRQVYIGNLSYRTSWQDLKDFAKSAGEVEFCDVLADKEGRSAGSGLIRFATEEQAKTAQESLHDQELDGRKVFVREDREGKAIKGKSVVSAKGYDGYGGYGGGYGGWGKDSWGKDSWGKGQGWGKDSWGKDSWGKGKGKDGKKGDKGYGKGEKGKGKKGKKGEKY